MKTKMTTKRIIKAAALLLLLLLLPACVLAAEEIDTTRAVQLTVSFQDDGMGISGAEMKIYRVASVDKTGKRKLAAPFDRYNVNISVQSESDLSGLAGTLEGYVLRDKLAPTATGSTNGAGLAVFPGSGRNLQQGLYLIAGGRYHRGNTVYTIQPTVVQLPFWDEIGKRWSYDVIVSTKYESDEESEDPRYIVRKVLKVWKGDQAAEDIPKEVEVSLLCDGVTVDTVTLNADTLWRHSWRGLRAEHHWTVVEKEMENYEVQVTQEGITFVVTNTYKTPAPTPTPKPTSKPTLKPTTTPKRTPTPKPTATPKKTPTPSPTPSGSKLPQTGQLWWPVPMLLCAGLLLIVLGLLRRRRD